MRNNKTRIQQSYLIGSGMDHNLGGVPAHVYLESRGKNIEIDRLRKAWKKVLTLHGISTPLNDYVAYFDCSALQKSDAELEVEQYRQAFAQRTTSEEAEHSCGLALFRLPDDLYSLHFDMNLLATDPAGFQILLGHLAERYQGNQIVIGEADAHTNARDASPEDITYWEKQIEEMRPGSPLKTLQDPARMHHCRYLAVGEKLTQAEWGIVQKRAERFQVHPTTLAMVDFAYTLLTMAEDTFVLNLPVFGTELCTVEDTDSISDRTRLLMLPIKKSDGYQDILARYLDGMRHIRYDGLEVQTLLRKKYPQESMIAPIVFSATPGIELITKAFLECFGELHYMVSQTPQVCLDAQIYETCDGALIVWMVPEGLYDQQDIAAWFQCFKDRLIDITK